MTEHAGPGGQAGCAEERCVVQREDAVVAVAAVLVVIEVIVGVTADAFAAAVGGVVAVMIVAALG